MDSPRFEIRTASYDLPEASQLIETLQAYYRTLYRGPDSAPVDASEFAPPGGLFFLGYESETAVAMGGWRWIEPLADLDAHHPVEIKRMYVVPHARGRGYARLMLRRLEESAHGAGADAVVLSTGLPQQDAIALYRSSGYVDIPKFGYYAKYDSAVHLGKALNGTTAAIARP